jgi:ribosome-associated protein
VQSDQLLALVEDALKDMKARDVCVLYVKAQTAITDYMVIASGTSNRHARSIADHVVEKAKAAGEMPIGVEGQESGEWVLVDLDAVVVHVMQPDAREFYKLENLWDMESKSGPDGGRSRVRRGR